MKKILSFLLISSIGVNNLSFVNSCSLFEHKPLSKDVSSWDFFDIIMQNKDNIQQAVASGKNGIYLNPYPNSTPFVDENGTYKSIGEMWKYCFNDSEKDPKSEAIAGLQLNYFVDSFIVYWQNHAKNNKDAALKNEQSFLNNFDVVYYYYNAGKGQNVYCYPGEDDKYQYERIKEKDKGYFNKMADPSDNSNNTLTMNNLWINEKNTDTPEKKFGGEVAQMLLGFASASVAENFTVAFNFDLVIKKDTEKEITINGKKVTVPVSKDGYYFSQPTNDNYTYRSMLANLLVTM